MNEQQRPPLHRSQFAADPLDQLRDWLHAARAAGVHSPSSMVLCTVDAAGSPTPRSIPLRGFEDDGLLIYTNLASAKGIDLRERPGAVSALFHWVDIMRQVRVDARASILGADVADRHFAARPRQSQLNAWASVQSTVVTSRVELQQIAESVTDRFAGSSSVPRPPTWGVVALHATRLEFWQAGSDFVHDRLRYRRSPTDGWTVDRLGP